MSPVLALFLCADSSDLGPPAVVLYDDTSVIFMESLSWLTDDLPICTGARYSRALLDEQDTISLLSVVHSVVSLVDETPLRMGGGSDCWGWHKMQRLWLANPTPAAKPPFLYESAAGVALKAVILDVLSGVRDTEPWTPEAVALRTGSTDIRQRPHLDWPKSWAVPRACNDTSTDGCLDVAWSELVRLGRTDLGSHSGYGTRIDGTRHAVEVRAHLPGEARWTSAAVDR